MTKPRRNVLFITLDQFRADALSCAGHPVVRTPNLDALAATGVRFARHYSQAAPCAPGRAALYTGTYQMNNRVVANGTPLDARFDNIALVAQRAGYHPVMFGYTDQGVDPRIVVDPHDPRLSTYEGVLPGFECVLNLDEHHAGWMDWLRELGYDLHHPDVALATEHQRPVEHSVSTFFTDRFLDWLQPQQPGWFAHLSYIRPHPPFSAAGEFATMYPPGDCGEPLPIGSNRHRLHDRLLGSWIAAPTDPDELAHVRSQYFGMISEVDAQLGRIWQTLRDRGEWDDTVIVVTSDHGEQLGDQGLSHKAGFFESSYHIINIVRDPQYGSTAGTVVHEFTEAVDVLPTVCNAIAAEIPAQCDGYPLTPFLAGTTPQQWRDCAYYEWDWRGELIPLGPHDWPWDRRLERQNLAVRRTRDHAYVQFGDGSWRCYDLASDPTWQTEIDDPSVVLQHAQAMLTWRSQHLDRTMTGMLLRDGGIGRRPLPISELGDTPRRPGGDPQPARDVQTT
jgi:arylsulfatase A-like enzyme